MYSSLVVDVMRYQRGLDEKTFIFSNGKYNTSYEKLILLAVNLFGKEQLLC